METGGPRVTSNTTRQKRRPQPSDASGASKPGGRTIKRPRSENSPAATVTGDDAEAGAASGDTLPAGLHIVATPIGNIADITLRALDVLRRVDLIACEDTRVTGKLTARYAITTRRLAYNDHNAERIRPLLLDRLRRGERVALVSDAGTPLVSDPGYKLVQAVIAEKLPVTFIPGAAAPLAALALSGLPADRFLFAGFPPPRQAARRRLLAELAAVPATLILFESPRRLAESLADMAEILGVRRAAVARELTKRHEEVRRDTLAALARHYEAAGAPRGEIVVVIGPPDIAAADAAEGEAVLDARLRTALAGASLRDAAATVAAATGLPRRQVYARALALLEEDKKR
jgi:16S rRNA (cytidine1402-2'-O)-methyltransferase